MAVGKQTVLAQALLVFREKTALEALVHGDVHSERVVNPLGRGNYYGEGGALAAARAAAYSSRRLPPECVR